jgi:hypothetical protein
MAKSSSTYGASSILESPLRMLEVSQASAPHDHFLNPQPPSEHILTRTYESLRSIQDGSRVAVSRLAELLAAPDEAENPAKRGSQTRRDRTLSPNSRESRRCRAPGRSRQPSKVARCSPAMLNDWRGYGRVATKPVSWLVPAGGGSSGAGDWGWPGMMHRPLALISIAVPASTFVMAPLCEHPSPATLPRRK